MSDPDRSAHRQYLLGQATADDCEAAERAYCGDEAALDRMAAAEEDLVEDYVDNCLAPDERRQFERHYLTTAEHRVRVDTIRRLRAAADSQQRKRSAPVFAARPSREQPYWWLAAAAAVLLTIAGTWMFLPRRPSRTVAETPLPAAPNVPTATGAAPSGRAETPGARSPQVFAVSLSPAAVRSASTTAAIVMPPGTDVVGLRLEGEGAPTMISNARVAIRTVSGVEIWHGPATATDQPPGIVARADVPARLLHVDDYLVVLFGTDRSGDERERYRYFLRIRSR